MVLDDQIKADTQLQERFKRATKQVDAWKNTIESMPKGPNRENLSERHAKVAHLSSYVKERMTELPFARENGLEWLRNDAIAKLSQFETSVEELRMQVATVITAKVAEYATPRAQDPALGTQTPSSRPSVIAEMRKAASSLKPAASPLDSIGGRRSVIQEMRAAAAIAAPAPSSVLPEFGELECEVSGWRPHLEKVAAELRLLEQKPPQGHSQIQWRRKVMDLQAMHRRAMEKVGRCRGWIRSGAARLANSTDWRRDFSLARGELSELDQEFDHLKNVVELAALEEPTQVPLPKPIRTTVTFGPSSEVGARAMGFAAGA